MAARHSSDTARGIATFELGNAAEAQRWPRRQATSPCRGSGEASPIFDRREWLFDA
jgi:hypothetical protein